MTNLVLQQKFYQQIGSLLKKAREERGLDLDEASVLTDHSRNSLQLLEQGSINKLPLKTLGRIFKVFLDYNAFLRLEYDPISPAELKKVQTDELIGLLSCQLKQEQAN